MLLAMEEDLDHQGRTKTIPGVKEKCLLAIIVQCQIIIPAIPPQAIQLLTLATAPPTLPVIPLLCLRRLLREVATRPPIPPRVMYLLQTALHTELRVPATVIPLGLIPLRDPPRLLPGRQVAPQLPPATSRRRPYESVATGVNI